MKCEYQIVAYSVS